MKVVLLHHYYTSESRCDKNFEIEVKFIDNIFPDFIFDGVRISISRSSISCVGKKCNNFVLNAIDIFADGMVYYIIDQRGFLMDFMVEDHRCDIFQLLK